MVGGSLWVKHSGAWFWFWLGLYPSERRMVAKPSWVSIYYRAGEVRKGELGTGPLRRWRHLERKRTRPSWAMLTWPRQVEQTSRT